jgi:erythromycin esterase
MTPTTGPHPPRLRGHDPMRRLAATLAVLVTLAAAPAASQERPVVDWLRGRAVPLVTVEPESGLADLEPLRALIGNARVVMLGEATHGSREFFQLKHRIFEFLAREMGFTVFAQEGMFARTLAVNEFVAGRTSDAVGALGALGGWVRNTEEHLALIRWMHWFNRQAPLGRTLKFYGFDMQDLRTSLTALLGYLADVDPAFADSVRPILAPFGRLDSYDSIRAYSKWPEDSLAPIRTTIAATMARLRTHQQPYTTRTSRERWAVAVMHARVVAQGEETWRDPRWPSTGDLRDRFMAENIQAIMDLEGPAARIVVSAHNGHVTHGDWAGRPQMGSYLRDALGPDLLAIGFAFNRGSFQARHHETNEVVEHAVGPAPDGSVSWMLARVGFPVFLVDLRGAPSSDPVAEWLRRPHPERTVGAVFNPAWESIAIAPAEHYDVLLYVETTTRARPVTTPPTP